MGVGVERAGAHPRSSSSAKRGVAGEVGAQDQHVDEEAEDAFELGAVAPGDRGADGEVALAAVAHQQRLEGGQQHHEQGGAVRAGERLEARPACGVERQLEAPPRSDAVRGRGRSVGSSIGSRPASCSRQ